MARVGKMQRPGTQEVVMESRANITWIFESVEDLFSQGTANGPFATILIERLSKR
jgi:hypothetical protein